MRKIDAHLHINFKSITASSFIKYLNSNNIEKCWLLTWEELQPAIPSLYRNIPFTNFFDLYNRYPERIVPFYAPDPASRNIRERLSNYIAKGLKGCGELKVSYKWDNDIIAEYLDVLSDFKMPLIFHMEAPKYYYIPGRNYADRAFALIMNGAFNGITGYYLRKLAGRITPINRHIQKKSVYFPGYLFDFAALEKRISEYPQIKFIGHGPHFWNNISAGVSGKYFYQKGSYKDFGIIDLMLEKYDNFYCDISGRGGYNALRRDRRRTGEFLKKHSNKILFGTDNFDQSKLENVILAAGLNNRELERIFFRNAEEILN